MRDDAAGPPLLSTSTQLSSSAEINPSTRAYQLNRGQAIGASLQKIWKSHSIPISTTIRLKTVLAWPVATYGSESWTLRKNEEARLDAFEMKGQRKILRVSWTAKKTNEWVLNKAGVKRELLDPSKQGS